MARILFLAHRIPYPPNKGDKIRSWHFLEYLVQRHEVHLGFFVDAEEDLKHIGFLEKQCSSVEHCFASPLTQKIASVAGFINGTSLTENAYPSRKMRRFVASLIEEKEIDAVFLFSAATFTFLPRNVGGLPVITDFVDVDSAKWEAYAESGSWPMSMIFKREANKLAAFEAKVAQKSIASILVSDNEAVLMKERLAVKTSNDLNILGITNGVDTRVFSPGKYTASVSSNQMIFTGAMDYAPNVEAVEWFVKFVFQRLKKDCPDVEFVIAGRPVAPSVQKLDAYDGVKVVGAVDDMAETISRSAIVVAPLLTARGIQNKVLEGMAMGKPVIATSAANEGINAPYQEAIWIADDADAFIEATKALLNQEAASKMGSAARHYVDQKFNWAASCKKLEKLIVTAIERYKTTTDKEPA